MSRYKELQPILRLLNKEFDLLQEIQELEQKIEEANESENITLQEYRRLKDYFNEKVREWESINYQILIALKRDK